MVDFASTVTNTLSLLGTACLMIVVAYLTVAFNNKKLSNKNPWISRVLIGVVFGLLAAYGTIMAVKLSDGTIPNVRELGAMMAGVAGGPVGGLIAGIIGGLHRFSIGGVTVIPCSLATVLVGLISGIVSVKLTGKYYLLKAAALGLVMESFAMGLVFVFVPFETAYMTVYQVFIPMIGASTIGLMFWSYFLNKLRAPKN